MRKLNITVLVGLIVAALGAGLVLVYGSRVDSRVAQGKETVPVLVAREALLPGSTAGDVGARLVVQQVPRLYVAEGALQDLSAVEGQVLLGPVGKGSQVTAAQFGEPGSTATVKVAKGRVALAVGVALTPGVARYVTPDSAVDVFVTYTGGAGGAAAGAAGQSSQPRTKLFASGVRVMSVRVAAPEATAEGDAAPAAATDGQVIAVLDLSPAEAEKVVNATTLGSIYLALTSSEDKAPHKTRGATQDDVLGSNR